MKKLNQIIALEKGVKSRSYSVLTEAHKKLQKSDLLSGISRTYRPKDEEGERYPNESTRVRLRADDVIKEVTTALAEFFDVTLTKDVANQQAKADIVVDGVTLLKQVPVTYLLFLEKQLVDLRTFVDKLPVLDAAEDWHLDRAQDCWANESAETAKTKKVPKNHVKAEATEKHPAQVETYHEDVVVGYWKTTKFSGALPTSQVRLLLNRVEKLQKAVKLAREEANAIDATQVNAGDAIFNYLIGEK